ncbi:MAG: uroporphyrinogen-III C-methyltransferase, partial [Gemmataceae bacterium]
VTRRILDMGNPAAEKVCIREFPGQHPDKYPQVHARIVDEVRAGKVVVRLKGGDPLVFGRGGEEAEMLRASGVPYEIVPGVTAALAAAAYMDIPLTHRAYSSAVAFVTGHELPSKPHSKLDWRVIAAFPGTLAIYMGIARLPLIVAELLKHGRDPQTPAAVVERASTGEMRRITAPLIDLDQSRRNAGLEAPGLILIGEAVAQKPERSWFELRPLFGYRVLVTRPRHQAEPLLRELESLGAVPSLLPTIEVRAADPAPIRAAIDEVRAGKWDWLVFTSANGVEAWMRELWAAGYDARALGRVQLAAIGPKTSEALQPFGLKADLVPTEGYHSAGLAAKLRETAPGLRYLLARADRGKETLEQELRTIGIVGTVTVYEQHDVIDAQADVWDALRRGEINFILLTSPNVARIVTKGFDDTIRGRVERGEIVLIAGSAEIAATVVEQGLPRPQTTETPTTNGFIDALTKAVSGGRAGH